MLSRVADSVFWMARYMERTDNVLRVLRTNYIASQDEIQNFNWKLWVDGLGANSPVSELEVNGYRDAIFHLVLNKENDNAVIVNIIRARENARAVQDYITKELWQCINEYYHLIQDKQTEVSLLKNDPVTTIDKLLKESILFYGTVDVTMSRGEGYTFLNIGKFMERSLRTLDILELKLIEMVSGGNEAMHWKYLLYSLSGYEFHTKQYKNALQMNEVVHQIIHNTLFPHSVLYNMLQVERYFKRLDTISLPENFKEMEFLIGKSVNGLRYGFNSSISVEELKEQISHARKEIKSIAYKLSTLYFGYT
ncbi:MAG: alpha-E domain-containing protein [Cyclobacteriaceae bacterium]|nr:alpha-E domain-containing protein [Cyclobacteriaceae bacterium]